MLSPLTLTLSLVLSPAGGVRIEGEHVAVIVHHSDEHWSRVLGEQLLPVVEAGWIGAQALLGIEPGEDEAAEDDAGPEIHVYRRAADFNRIQKRAGIAAERVGELRFGGEGLVAHVPLQPKCSVDVLKGLGVPPPTQRAAARAAAVLGLRAGLEPDGMPPGWWVAGVSAWIAQGVLERGGESGPALEEPWVAARLTRAAAALASSGDEGLAALTSGEVLDPGARSALAEALCFYLWSRPGTEPPVTLSAPEGRTPEAWMAVLAPAGSGSEEVATAAGLPAWLAAYEPHWREERGFMSRSGDGWLQVAPPKADALCWAPPVGRNEYTVRGRFTLLPGRRHANIALGLLNGGYIVLNITGSDGAYCFVYDAAADTWDNQRYAPSPALSLGTEVTFAAVVIDERIELHVNGVRVFAIAVQGRDMSGSWGLGAPGGSVVRWREVVVE